jgi:hypothetical protein
MKHHTVCQKRDVKQKGGKKFKEFLMVGCVTDREWHFTGMTQDLYPVAFCFYCHPTLLITFTKLDQCTRRKEMNLDAVEAAKRVSIAVPLIGWPDNVILPVALNSHNLQFPCYPSLYEHTVHKATLHKKKAKLIYTTENPGVAARA